MYKKYLALSALAATAQAQQFLAEEEKPVEAKNNHWAVLVAGSNGYYNYRHQADTCHAYQIMKANGIPEDQIIHMAYDDIANSSSNPFPGKIYNHGADAPLEVYEGCKIDYTGSSVNLTTLQAVMEGKDTEVNGGKVLKSDADSKVFFYFADHGGAGIIALPSGPYVTSKDLHEIVKNMHTNKMYKEMTMYIEACESGSMFQNILEDDLDVYAVSAANATESSWGTYCTAPDNVIDGKSIGTCLGDQFSVAWMEDTDKANIDKETLSEQYLNVKSLTTKSHVLQWGQTTFTDEALADFQSGHDITTKHKPFWKQFHKQMKHMGKKVFDEIIKMDQHNAIDSSSIDSRDVKLHYLFEKAKTAPTEENFEALKEEMIFREKTETTFSKIFENHMEAFHNGTTPLPTNWDCYKNLIQTYEDQCGPIGEYGMKFLKLFVAECEALKTFPDAIEFTMRRFNEVCPVKK